MADKSPHQQPPSFSNANANVNAHPDDQQIQFEAKVEDAETRAAREELKHTVISDTQRPPTETDSGSSNQIHSQHHQRQYEDEDHDGDAEMTAGSGTRRKTPDLAPPEVLSRSGPAPAPEKVSSPKKKRAHDEVEQHKEGDGHRTSSGAESEGGWVMVDGAENDKEHRSEPQKKRARDETSPPADIHKATATVGFPFHFCLRADLQQLVCANLRPLRRRLRWTHLRPTRRRRTSKHRLRRPRSLPLALPSLPRHPLPPSPPLGPRRASSAVPRRLQHPHSHPWAQQPRTHLQQHYHQIFPNLPSVLAARTPRHRHLSRQSMARLLPPLEEEVSAAAAAAADLEAEAVLLAAR